MIEIDISIINIIPYHSMIEPLASKTVNCRSQCVEYHYYKQRSPLSPISFIIIITTIIMIIIITVIVITVTIMIITIIISIIILLLL